MRIAIADSDQDAADVLSFAAQRRGHQTVCVPGISPLFDRLPFAPSVVVAALRGAEAEIVQLQRLRAHYPEVAILVTVERPREPLPSMLMKAGASEVVRSPYNPNELVLRAEAWAAARMASAGVDDVLRTGDIEVALDRYTALKNGKPLTLTKLELRLLYCLCEHSPHLAPLERLLTFGWESLGDPEPTLIKTHISHLRKKLREAGGQQFEIASRQTVGYALTIGAGA